MHEVLKVGTNIHVVQDRKTIGVNILEEKLLVSIYLKDLLITLNQFMALAAVFVHWVETFSHLLEKTPRSFSISVVYKVVCPM